MVISFKYLEQAIRFLTYKAYDPMFELVGDAVVNVYENHDEKIAFLQLKEQTKHIIVLDGIV